MKVLFVLENYFPNVGGVETLFKSLVEELEQDGVEIVLLTTRLNKSDPIRQQVGNILVIRLPFPNRYFFTLLAFFPILWYTRGCHLIHTTSYNAGFPTFFAAKLARKKVIITFHEVWGELWFRLPFMGKSVKWGHYIFEQCLLKLPFNKFIAVSEFTAGRLAESGIRPDRIETIYNGLNYDEFTLSKPVTKKTNFHFTFFGRLGISKGLDILIDAAEIFSKENPESSMTLIVPRTPDSFLKIIKQLINEKQLNHYIAIKHELPFEQLKQEILTSSCVVIPSYSEGFCYAAIESMALGVPVISSDQGALKDVINGKFIRMEALSADALVDALRKASNGAWEETPRVRYPLSETTANYIRLYKELLQSPSLSNAKT